MPIKIIRKPPPAPAPASVIERPAAPKSARVDPAAERPVLDAMCKAVMNSHVAGVVPWLLMASYMYYEHDESILSDGLFDSMCQTLLAKWDMIEHMHKHLITKGMLEAGSLHTIRTQDYPNSVKGAACRLVKTNWGITLPET